MLEKDVIQQRGFHNIVKDGQAVGFQVRVRATYYRGIYLSEIFPGAMVVDGRVFPKEQIIWEINGKEFTTAEMETAYNEHWCSTTDADTLKVYIPGGLETGYHDMEVRFKYTSSYLPPQLQQNMDPDADNTVNHAPGFGSSGRYQRRLLLV